MPVTQEHLFIQYLIPLMIYPPIKTKVILGLQSATETDYKVRYVQRLQSKTELDYKLR